MLVPAESVKTSRHRGRKRIAVLAALGMVLAAVMWLGRGRLHVRSARERLAEINAVRALPRGENAATIYEDLAISYPPPYGPSDPNRNRAVIARLLEASKRGSCYFPLEPTFAAYWEQGRDLSVLRQWATLLQDAGEEDMSQGRFDVAREKLVALMQLGRHLQQQPTYVALLTGLGAEGAAWTSLRDYVMSKATTATDWKAVAAIPTQLRENWAELSRPAKEVQPVFSATYQAEFDRWFRSQYGLWRWARMRVQVLAEKPIDARDGPYLRVLAMRRGVHILVGLRLYHDAHGGWPGSLEQIRGLVPPEALTDPFGGQPFVYKTATGGFRLYSRGPNRIDDNGMRGRGGPDDLPIWPGKP